MNEVIKKYIVPKLQELSPNSILFSKNPFVLCRKIFFCLMIGAMFCVTTSIKAQDAHFSQSYVSPMTLNPAMTGLIDGKYRISGIYRDQWRAIVDQPFTTFSISGDFKFQANDGGQSKNPDYFGVGIGFVSDKVGLVDFSTNAIAISTGYHKALGKALNQYLSVGAQFSINQRNVNFEHLNFQDEFDGIQFFDQQTAENLPANNFGYGDFAIGIHYSMSPSKYMNLFLGTSLYHATSPRIVFQTDETSSTFSDGFQVKHYKKLQIHGGFSYEMAGGMSLIPRMVLSKQGPHTEVLLGSNVKFNDPTKSTGVQFGIWGRAVDNFNGQSLESVILAFGVDFSGAILGLSYDITLDGIRGDFRNQGVFELSFTYTGDFENDEFFCPEF